MQPTGGAPKGKGKQDVDPKILIVLGALVVVALLYFFVLKKKPAPAVPAPAVPAQVTPAGPGNPSTPSSGNLAPFKALTAKTLKEKSDTEFGALKKQFDALPRKDLQTLPVSTLALLRSETRKRTVRKAADQWNQDLVQGNQFGVCSRTTKGGILKLRRYASRSGSRKYYSRADTCYNAVITLNAYYDYNEKKFPQGKPVILRFEDGEGSVTSKGQGVYVVSTSILGKDRPESVTMVKSAGVYKVTNFRLR